MLEEHTPSADGDDPGALRTWDTEAILLSAPDRAGLIERVRELIDWLKRDPPRHAQGRRLHAEQRRAAPARRRPAGIVASSLAELSERLTAVLAAD